MKAKLQIASSKFEFHFSNFTFAQLNFFKFQIYSIKIIHPIL